MNWSVLLPVKLGAAAFDGAGLHRVLTSWSLQHPLHDKTVEVLILNRTSYDITGLIPDSSHAIRVIDVAEVGPASALNVGLAEAIGDYVFFATDDDFAHPGLLRAHDELHGQASVVYARELRMLEWRTDPLISRSPATWTTTDLEALINRCAIGDRELTAEADLALLGMAQPLAWMLIREGRMSLSRKVCDVVGLFDSSLDPDGWYLTEDYAKRLHMLSPTFAVQVGAPLIYVPWRDSTSWPPGAQQRAAQLAQKHKDLAFTLFDQYFREKLTLPELVSRARSLK